MRREWAYFPGCMLRQSAAEYAGSLEAAFAHMGIALEEVPDWNCCGATSAHAVAPEAAAGLNARTLASVSLLGKPVLAPCSICYSNLRAAALSQGTDAALVAHPLEALATPEALSLVAARTVTRLTGMRVVSYYGCLLSRPPGRVDFDDAENPQSMDAVVAALGAEPVDWLWKTECCGASLSSSSREKALALAARILSGAADAGADAIAVACPLCHFNLDVYQYALSRMLKRRIETPVFYFSELMAMAFDLEEAEGCLRRHVTTPFPLVDRLLGAMDE